MLLSRDAILAHREFGSVVIEPFNPDRLNTASYDVTIGVHTARTRSRLGPFVLGSDPQPLFTVLSNSKEHYLNAGERILAHTNEVVGGRRAHRPWRGTKAVNTELRATSTMARHGITICQCAGWGDVGYVDRWTLEVTNHNPFPVVIPVGTVVGQIVFHEVAPPSGADYREAGSYNTGRKWKPQDMLPKAAKVKP